MINPSTPIETIALGRWLEKKVTRGKTVPEAALKLVHVPESPSSPASTDSSTNSSLSSSTRSLFFGRTLPDPCGLPIRGQSASDPSLHSSPPPATSADMSTATPPITKTKAGVRFKLPPPEGAHLPESAEHEEMECDQLLLPALADPSTPNATTLKTRAIAARQHDVRSTVAVASPLHRVHAHRRSYSTNRPPPIALRPSRTVHLMQAPSPTARWAPSAPTRSAPHRSQPAPPQTRAPVPPRTPLPAAPVVGEQQLREHNLGQLLIGDWLIPAAPPGYEYAHDPARHAICATHDAPPLSDAAHGAALPADPPHVADVAGRNCVPFNPVHNMGTWITARMARHLFFGGRIAATLPDGSPLVLAMSKEQLEQGLPVPAMEGVPYDTPLGEAMWAEQLQARKEGRRLEYFKLSKFRVAMERSMRSRLQLVALPDPTGVPVHPPNASPEPVRSSPPATPMVKAKPEF